MLLLLLLWGQWPVAGISSEAWLIWPLSAVPHNRRIGWQRVTNYKRANFQNKKSSRPNCMAWQTSSEALYSLIPTFCLSTSAWSQLRLRKSPQKKTHLLLGISQIAPPPSRILANFSFLRTCQIQFGQGSPLHTDWATFSLWKRCENHFGQEKKLTGHLLQRLPVIEGAALAARLSWWRRDSDLTLYININLWHNEYEIFKPRLCSVIFFINPPKRFQEWKVHIEIEIEGRLTCALSRSELRYLPLGLLKVRDWSCD